MTNNEIEREAELLAWRNTGCIRRGDIAQTLRDIAVKAYEEAAQVADGWIEGVNIAREIRALKDSLTTS